MTTISKFEPELFREFLNLFWLRPEGGAVTYYQSRSWRDVPIESPSLDISTGDGIFAFVHCGGRFDERFDTFASTAASDFSHDRFIDIYDVVDESYSPLIRRAPTDQFTVGTDWKAALLDKATKLHFFQRLVQHDNNALPLPFDPGSFRFIHSNAVYWARDPRALVRDIFRIMTGGAAAVLEVCTPRILATLDRLRPILGTRATSILDRKRSEEMKALTVDGDTWSGWMAAAGFKIEDVRVAWPNAMMTDVWNVGTRPLSHLLICMARQLPQQEYVAIKRQWVDICFDVLVPVCENVRGYDIEDAPYLTYLLRKPA